MKRIPVFLESSPWQVNHKSRLRHGAVIREREREREGICGSREEGAENNGHDLDDSNAFTCLRSEKKLFVYTS